MKKIKYLLAYLSSLVLLSSCSIPDITFHPQYPIRPDYIFGRWILPFDKTDPPLYDTESHHFTGTPDYLVLDFKPDETFSVEIHKKNKVSILRKKDMKWWNRISENTNDTGPVVALKNMRYYPSALTWVKKHTPNNPEELMLEQGLFFSKNPDNLYLCFEDADIDLCFSRETPYKESTQLNAN